MNRIPLLTVVYAGVALSNIGIGMIVPILPLYAHTYGASSFVIGLMVSALAIGRLTFQIPGGYLADTHRTQQVAAFGFLLYVPSLLGMAFLPHPYLFIGFRFLEGCAEGIALPALYALITASVPKEKIGATFGVFSSVATVGSALGPLIGGGVIALTGPYILFILAAIGPLFCALALFFLIQTPVSMQVKSKKQKSLGILELMGMLRQSSVPLVLLPIGIFAFTANFAFAVVQVIFPLYIVDRFHTSYTLVGLLFTINFFLFAIGLLVAGRISDYLRAGNELLLGGIVVGAIFLLLPLASSYWVFVCLFTVEAFAASWILVGNRRVIGNLIEQNNAGKAYGLIGACGDAGLLVGPLIVGAVYQPRGIVPFLLTGGLSLLGCTLCLPLLRRKTVTPPIEPPAS